MFSPSGPINSIFDLSSGAAMAVKLKPLSVSMVAACFNNLFCVDRGELNLMFVPIIDRVCDLSGLRFVVSRAF
ncbi:hypothetical protein PES01_26120 [Pseudoalteromonas espejiana]|uniref:Uncharacterized protein n=1 Tax=Pseudoalteromonas espejiana TaxID=28107 RepID=A0A510XZ50_9GAMM|nr:hypothetical protein PES01_26120 [Pseudoalteromonas espejiana]